MTEKRAAILGLILALPLAALVWIVFIPNNDTGNGGRPINGIDGLNGLDPITGQPIIRPGVTTTAPTPNTSENPIPRGPSAPKCEARLATARLPQGESDNEQAARSSPASTQMNRAL